MAVRDLVALAARVAELERRVAGMVRHGTVAEVDAAGGRVRLNLGPADGGGDFLSPWVPYSQPAGALRAHIPPAPGQQFTMVAPGGDWVQAVALPATFSDAIPSPSGAGDENVIAFGDVTITLRSGGLDIVAGGVTLSVSGAGLSVSGGDVSHDGRSIGAGHRHTSVMSGAGVSGPPQP